MAKAKINEVELKTILKQMRQHFEAEYSICNTLFNKGIESIPKKFSVDEYIRGRLISGDALNFIKRLETAVGIKK